MSLSILFETKRRYESDSSVLQPESVSKARGFLSGSDVIVTDTASTAFLIDGGFYGSFLAQRMNFYNTSCFPEPVEPSEGEDKVGVVNPGVEWLAKLNAESQKRMYLSAEEAIYLMKIDKLEIDGVILPDLWNFYVCRDGVAFKRRYLVYEHFRKQRWTVRAAVNFSGDYSLYKESPKTCHSSIVVQIVPNLESINSVQTIAMRRQLKNVKKALILVIVNLDDAKNWDSINYDSHVKIETYHNRSPMAAHKIELLG